MKNSEIEFLIKQGEGYNIEFKRKITKELANEVCAFCNSTGGIIIIGIDDDNSIIGANDTNENRSKLQNTISAINPKPEITIEKIDYQDKILLVVKCENGQQKPYIYSGGIYVRVGANTQKLTRAEEMREFFQQQNKIYFDASPCDTFIYPKDFSKDKFKSFCKQAKISSELTDKTILENLQIFNNNSLFKNGGVLFFANNTQKHIENSEIRGILFKGHDKRYIIDDKAFTGNLIEQYDEAVKFVKSKLELRYEIESQGTKPRLEKYEIPEIVFKEAIINALIHRDYYEKGGVIHIEIYDNRMEISNPGGLVAGIPEKEFGRRSLSRNPLIFGLFQRLNLVEKIGTGIPRMRRVLSEENLPAPKFSIKGMFIITLYRPLNFDNWIAQWSSKLNKTQQAILVEINRNKEITQAELSKLVGVGKTAIYNNISILKELELLDRIGSDKSGYWTIYYKSEE